MGLTFYLICDILLYHGGMEGKTSMTLIYHTPQIVLPEDIVMTKKEKENAIER